MIFCNRAIYKYYAQIEISMLINSSNVFVKLILKFQLNNKYLLFLFFTLFKILFINKITLFFNINNRIIEIDYPITIINVLFIGNSNKNLATSLFVYFFLKESSVFLDIGANEGNISSFALNKIKKGKVITFEPDIINYQRLTKRFEGNANIINFNVALSDIIEPYFMKKTNFFKLRTGMKISNSNKSTNFTKLLDDYELNNEFKKIDLIKIDTEGYDVNVLKGAKNIILKHKPVIIVEINNNDQFDNILKIIPHKYKYIYKINNKHFINTNIIFKKIDKNEKILGDIILSQEEINSFLS